MGGGGQLDFCGCERRQLAKFLKFPVLGPGINLPHVINVPPVVFPGGYRGVVLAWGKIILPQIEANRLAGWQPLERAAWKKEIWPPAFLAKIKMRVLGSELLDRFLIQGGILRPRGPGWRLER